MTASRVTCSWAASPDWTVVARALVFKRWAWSWMGPGFTQWDWYVFGHVYARWLLFAKLEVHSAPGRSLTWALNLNLGAETRLVCQSCSVILHCQHTVGTDLSPLPSLGIMSFLKWPLWFPLLCAGKLGRCGLGDGSTIARYLVSKQMAHVRRAIDRDIYGMPLGHDLGIM